MIIGFNGSPGNVTEPQNYVLSRSSSGDISDNEDDDEHELDSSIELEADTKSILASSGTETVYFYAETFIETEEILLVDANTGTTVATMVDDGQYPISGDDLMNDNVFSSKVEIDISKEKIYEFYAVIGDTGNDAIISNTVKIKVYAGYTEEELLDRNEVKTVINMMLDSDEFKSMDLDVKIEAMNKLLVELSENGTPEAPHSLIKRETIRFDKENCQYTFVFQSGGIVVIPLDEVYGHE